MSRFVYKKIRSSERERASETLLDRDTPLNTLI